MLVGVLTALGVLGAIALLVVLFLQRGRDGMDLSLGGLLRVYLYLASLAGVIAFAIGLAGIIAYVLAAAFGLDVIYGGPRPNIQPAFPIQVCPPGTHHRSPRNSCRLQTIACANKPKTSCAASPS
jgi:hypothetical protein